MNALALRTALCATLLVPAGAALADAVKRALFLPAGEWENLSHRVRETDFSWGPAVARLEELQRRLLRKTGRTSV